MITDGDIKKLKKVFATKNDLKRFATKDDLKRFATKDDVKQDLRDLKEDMLEAMDKQKDEIIEAVADLIRRGVNPMLDDHEGRIRKLEKRVVTTP